MASDGSRGSLDGATLHDLAGDVAGVIKAIGCGPAHLVGHAFGNRIARCLAVDRPPLVRSVTLLAAGGLIAPSTPIGTRFRNATQVKMNGSDCVTVLGARWLSPASDPKILARVECWPAVFIAHLATSRNVPLEYWWSAGTAPLLVIQGLDDEAAPPGNGHALREQFGERVRVVDLPRAGHFLLLEQPEAVARAVSEFLGGQRSEADDTPLIQLENRPMTDIILHHYDTSPYSEKVRLGLGLKGLAWASVELPQSSCRNRI